MASQTTSVIVPRCLHACRALVILGGALLAATSSAMAQVWPQRPIKIIVPVTAGGVVDLAARLLVPALSRQLGQPVIVENRPGADQVIGTSAVARSPADGYAWLLATSSSLTNVPLIKHVDYHPLKDFAPVTLIGYVSQALLVPPALGVRSLEEFVALARSTPGTLSYAHSGDGTVGQLNAFLLTHAAHIDVQPIAYKGASAALGDLMTNRVNLALIPSASAAPQVRAGQLRALGVVGKGRSVILPETPTLAELGYPSVNLVGWIGVLMPAGTPATVVERAHAALSAALADADTRARLAELDVSLQASASPDAFSRQIANEVAAMPALFKAANITSEKQR